MQNKSESPRWMTYAGWGILAYVPLAFLGGPALGIPLKPIVGSLMFAFGVMGILTGAFGQDFRRDDGGGDDGEGTPIGPDSIILARLAFIVIGLIFVIGGVAMMFSASWIHFD